jgi:N4-gp56 family major capsid protein
MLGRHPPPVPGQRLRSSTSTGQWFDIQKAAMQGGSVSDSSLIFTESLGMYRDMLLVESVRVPTFTNAGAGANVSGARALFLGAQAAVVAHGKGTNDQGRLELAERTFDYGKRKGVGMTLIWGMAKTRFNNQSDFGVFAIDTAAAAH